MFYRFFFIFVIVNVLFFNNQPIFSEETSNPIIYLATYPRSGNHWVRYVIEEAAQVTTSSVYIDPDHSTIGAWGGYYQPNGYNNNCREPNKGEVVILKTHFPAFGANSYDLQESILTIRIVRHPVDSIYSFHLYNFANDTTTYGTRISFDMLKCYVENWRMYQEYWDQQENVLTIYYEDLMEDPHFYFSMIMNATGYEVDEEDILRAVEKFPPQGKVLKHLACFEKEDLEFIQKELSDLLYKHCYNIPIED